jgi:hypothetical protein
MVSKHGLTINSVAGRMFELRKMRFVEEAFQDKCKISGRTAIYWKTTEKNVSQEVIPYGEKIRQKRILRKEKLGYINSPEARIKIGKGNAGKIGWNKGKTFEEVYGEEKAKAIKERISQTSSERLGDKNPAWKGGISSLSHSLRYCKKYAMWRTEVFERDNFTCQDCKNIGGLLEAHHKKSFALIIEENNITSFAEGIDCLALWDKDNGETLCIECHALKDLNRGHTLGIKDEVAR